jgi:hypothetical protein
MPRRGFTVSGTGPMIYDFAYQWSMRPHSVTLHSINEWRNRTGDFSITLERPNNPSVILYLMVR